MRIATINKFGSPDVVKIMQGTVPVPSSKQILVKLKAASVNPVDAQIRMGHYEQYTPLPFNLGFDGAGIVETVGEQVSDFKAGDRVFFVPPILNGQGTYSDYCVVDAELAAPIPEALSYIEAAALSLTGSAAWEAIFDRGRLQSHETVLIHAGAGGVGHVAIQIAKAIGSKVITTARKSNNTLLKGLGADIVIDYEDDDFMAQLVNHAGSDGVHLVVDTIAGNTIMDSAQVLAPYGRIVSLADYCPPQNLISLWPKNAEIHLVFMTPSADRLKKLAELVEQDKLKIIVDKVFPLEQVAKAHEYLASRGRTGKIVLSIE